jgi:hypothetical protein
MQTTKDELARAQIQLCLSELVGLRERVRQLEKLVQYPNTAKQETLKSQAVQAQAAQQNTSARDTAYGLYAPLRSDTAPLIRLAAFARRLLDPSDLGHAVTEEVRNLAREALGK